MPASSRAAGLFWNSFSRSQSGRAIRKERNPLRRKRQIGLEQPLELQERLVVEDDVVDLVEPTLPSPRQYSTALMREAGVVLLAREALLLRGRDDAPVATSAAALSW